MTHVTITVPPPPPEWVLAQLVEAIKATGVRFMVAPKLPESEPERRSHRDAPPE